MAKTEAADQAEARETNAPPAPENPLPVQVMAHRLRTPENKKIYALRKQTPEPVFGVIKSMMGLAVPPARLG